MDGTRGSRIGLIYLASATARQLSSEVIQWRRRDDIACGNAAAKQRTERGLQALLLQALVATGADFGNIQLLEPDGLRIAAQYGFGRRFLAFFCCVKDGGSACGAALGEGRRVIVESVPSHPIFQRSAAAEILRDAEVEAVQSTPLFAAAGRLLGVLSTHYRRPRQFRASELDILDIAARRAAHWVEASLAAV